MDDLICNIQTTQQTNEEQVVTDNCDKQCDLMEDNMIDSFDLIAGYSKEKEQLMSMRNLLKNYEKYEEMGIHIPRGVLLYGQPGMGKTKMARAIACDGINVVELLAGECTATDPANSIQNVFNKARQSKPCLLILDEIDKLTERSIFYHNENNEKVKKVLLQELDGHSDNTGVLVVATCNNYDNMDKALLRTGRFDRMIGIEPPEIEDRKEILTMYFSKVKINKEIDLDSIAQFTEGNSCATLESLVNESSIATIEKGVCAITTEICQEALTRIETRSLATPIDELEHIHEIAIHEAGHAVMLLLTDPERFLSVTVISHGSIGGFVHHLPNKNVKNSAETEKSISISLGGMVAEKLFIGGSTAGCSDDLNKAWTLLNNGITKFGFYGTEHLIFESGSRENNLVSEAMLEQICKLRADILARIEAKVTNLLKDNSDLVLRIAEELEKKYILSAKQIKVIMDEVLELRKAA